MKTKSQCHAIDSLTIWAERAEQFDQPRPQDLLLVQNGGSEKPLAKAAEILHESWSILSRDT